MALLSINPPKAAQHRPVSDSAAPRADHLTRTEAELASTTDGAARAVMACRVSDHRTADLPEQLLADPAPPTWPRAYRAIREGMDRMGWARVVRPLDRRVRGPSRRPRARPRRLPRRSRDRTECLGRSCRHRKHVRLRKASEGD